MFLLFIFLYLTYSSEAIIRNINVGVILDTTPSYLMMSELLFKSFNLAFSNYTYKVGSRNFMFVNKNVTDPAVCNSVADYVFSEEIDLLFVYTNPVCRDTIYDMNYDKKVLLLVPDIYRKLQCIKFSVHAGMLIHEIHMLLSQLNGDVIILSYEDVSDDYNDLFLPSNNYNFININYRGLIVYTSLNDAIKQIKQNLPNGGNIVSSLTGTDTDDLLNKIKSDNINGLVIYSLDNSVNSVYTSNVNAVNNYLFVKYIEDIESTEFTQLYRSKYGNSDTITILLYMTFYMIKHWLDCIDKLVFYEGIIIKNEYKSNIITPETTLHYHINNFFYSDYYLFKVNGGNNLEMVQKFNKYSDLDDRSFSTVISNITNQDLCNMEIVEVKYIALLYNEYMIENVNDVMSSLDVIASELSHFYKSDNTYNLRIIKKIIPDTVKELEEMVLIIIIIII